MPYVTFTIIDLKLKEDTKVPHIDLRNRSWQLEDIANLPPLAAQPDSEAR